MLQHPIFVFFLAAAACSAGSSNSLNLSLEDRSSEDKISIQNHSNQSIILYYNYDPSYGDLQMFQVRFRDGAKRIIEFDGTREGWFTPKIYISSLDTPQRRKLIIPAGSFVHFDRDVGYFARSVRAIEEPEAGPCEVQIKLFGYADRHSRKSVEAVSQWQPGPCPGGPLSRLASPAPAFRKGGGEMPETVSPRQ